MILKRDGVVLDLVPPPTKVNNLIFGRTWIDSPGEMIMTNQTTGDKAVLCFQPCGWFGYLAHPFYDECISLYTFKTFSFVELFVIKTIVVIESVFLLKNKRSVCLLLAVSIKKFVFGCRAGRYEVDGYVYNSAEEPKLLITGKWNESLSYQPCDLEGEPTPGTDLKEVASWTF